MPSNKLNITDLDFDDIKSNLKTYLRSQQQFEDYDFEGSSMSILLDVLSYNTHYMGFYANMLANEMFLDSSSLRSSIVSHAKHLNVSPTSKRSANAELNFTFLPTGSPSSLSIPKNTRFTSSIDGVKYTFVTTKTITVTRSIAGTYVATNVNIKEGRILSKRYDVNGSDLSQRFILPNSDIDTSSVKVNIQTSASDTTIETFSNANSLDINTIKGNDRVYFIEEIEGQEYELIFGDGSVGKQLTDGNIIFIEYMVTSGSLANNCKVFTAIGTVAGLDSGNYVITTSTTANGGSEIQSSESLKFLAPKLYSAQGRACTKEDYKAILLEQRPDIESITVYGGEDADPVQYGKVFIAAKPQGNNTYSTSTKEAIKTSILKKLNVVTIQPEIIDPIFFYIVLDVVVNYDPVTNLSDETTLMTNINSSVQNYLQKNLEKFDQKFRYSQLVQDIDNTNSSIRNNKTSVKYRQRVTPISLAESQTFILNFNNKIDEGSLVSESFIGTDGNIYSLIDDKNGKVKAARTTNGVVDVPSVFLTQSNDTQDQGEIDYATGKVTLNSLTLVSVISGDLFIRVTVTPKINNNDIVPLREQILTYDINESDTITINMVAETII
tara:strand:+ start:4306 stop:6132 length:1827 start_codon:yes stop_codon:yes gene_type:complete